VGLRAFESSGSQEHPSTLLRSKQWYATCSSFGGFCYTEEGVNRTSFHLRNDLQTDRIWP
jgi:hypothetical protein